LVFSNLRELFGPGVLRIELKIIIFYDMFEGGLRRKCETGLSKARTILQRIIFLKIAGFAFIFCSCTQPEESPPPSTPSPAPKLEIPAPPSSIRTAFTGDGSVSLYWEHIYNAFSYEIGVFLGGAAAPSPEEIQVWPDVAFTINSKGVNALVKKLENNAVYWFYARSLNPSGEYGDWSPPERAVPHSRAVAVLDENGVEEANFGFIIQAIDYVNSISAVKKSYTIAVTSDNQKIKEAQLTAGKDLTLTSDGREVFLDGADGSMLAVSSGTLRLENITLTGVPSNTSALITVSSGAALTLDGGAVVCKNGTGISAGLGGELFILGGGGQSAGLSAPGGRVTGCVDGVKVNGGLCLVGEFAEIERNTGSGVSVLSGGIARIKGFSKIKNNGCGVNLTNGKVSLEDEALIEGNNAQAVYIGIEGVSFEMKGGTLKGGAGASGGVQVEGGCFKALGGSVYLEIEQNGGSVSVEDGIIYGAFTVKKETAVVKGGLFNGPVTVNGDGAALEMTGGEASKGVVVENGLFKMTGGNVSGDGVIVGEGDGAEIQMGADAKVDLSGASNCVFLPADKKIKIISQITNAVAAAIAPRASGDQALWYVTGRAVLEEEQGAGLLAAASAHFKILKSADAAVWSLSGGALAQAATVYVASNGDDAGDGSQSAPYATLEKAVEQTVTGGVIIISGSISPQSGWSGSPFNIACDKKITLEGVNEAELRAPPGAPCDATLKIDGTAIVEINGVKFKNDSSTGNEKMLLISGSAAVFCGAGVVFESGGGVWSESAGGAASTISCAVSSAVLEGSSGGSLIVYGAVANGARVNGSGKITLKGEVLGGITVEGGGTADLQNTVRGDAEVKDGLLIMNGSESKVLGQVILNDDNAAAASSPSAVFGALIVNNLKDGAPDINAQITGVLEMNAAGKTLVLGSAVGGESEVKAGSLVMKEGASFARRLKILSRAQLLGVVDSFVAEGSAAAQTSGDLRVLNGASITGNSTFEIASRVSGNIDFNGARLSLVGPGASCGEGAITLYDGKTIDVEGTLNAASAGKIKTLSPLPNSITGSADGVLQLIKEGAAENYTKFTIDETSPFYDKRHFIDAQGRARFNFAKGGNVSYVTEANGEVFEIHTFYAIPYDSQTQTLEFFKKPQGSAARVLVAAGGGSGGYGAGNALGGGGGAGGVREDPAYPLKSLIYTITVGASGKPDFNPGGINGGAGLNGGSSTISTVDNLDQITAVGGGGGASGLSPREGKSGGSGGGASGANSMGKANSGGGKQDGSVIGETFYGTFYGNPGGGGIDDKTGVENISAGGGGGAGSAGKAVAAPETGRLLGGGSGREIKISVRSDQNGEIYAIGGHAANLKGDCLYVPVPNTGSGGMGGWGGAGGGGADGVVIVRFKVR
jgi:hypothetical protein